ncbi:hypothetical protein Barb6_01603 [Bacteroidales bacterium Barb6]|nr:hypothetical protein Barb6_01603 [Bacteroidales bacterium Barb6]
MTNNTFLKGKKPNPDRVQGFTQPNTIVLDNDASILESLRHKDKNTDIRLKKTYGWGIIGVLYIWIRFVIAFLIIAMLCPNARKVSDTVFIALLTSATANILFLPAIVLKYLFPNPKQE